MFLFEPFPGQKPQAALYFPPNPFTSQIVHRNVSLCCLAYDWGWLLLEFYSRIQSLHKIPVFLAQYFRLLQEVKEGAGVKVNRRWGSVELCPSGRTGRVLIACGVVLQNSLGMGSSPGEGAGSFISCPSSSFLSLEQQHFPEAPIPLEISAWCFWSGTLDRSRCQHPGVPCPLLCLSTPGTAGCAELRASLGGISGWDGPESFTAGIQGGSLLSWHSDVTVTCLSWPVPAGHLRAPGRA